jgi:hypothetical protein
VGLKNNDLLVLAICVERYLRKGWESGWKNQKKLSELRKLSAYFAP